MPKKSKKDKKDKKAKTAKKPVKLGKTSKPKPRTNPNQVRRIPAQAGQFAGSNRRVEVVLPTGARGGDGSYKTRSKEEIQEEKLAKARETLGIVDATQVSLQQAPQRPVIQRQTGYIKPRNMEKFGGYSGLTEGYGVENSNKKMDSKLEAMEKRLLNQIKQQNTGKSSINEDASKGRISMMIEEVSSRKITDNEKDIQRKQELLKKRNRYKSSLPPKDVRTPLAVSRDFTFYGSSLPTDAEVQEDKKEKEEKTKIMLEEGKRFENTRNVRSLLDNIVDNAIDQSDIKTKKKIDADERSRILNERSIQKNNRRLENIRNKEERDRAIQEQKRLAEEQKRLVEENKEREKKQKQKDEIKQVSSDFVQNIIGSSLEKAEQDKVKKQKQKDDKEDEERPLEINRANIQTQFPKVQVLDDVDELISGGNIEISGEQVEESRFSDLTEDDKIGEMMETQEDITETGNRLIQVLEEEEEDKEVFFDTIEPPTEARATQTEARGNRPVPREESGSRPLPPTPQRPLPIPPSKPVPTKQQMKEQIELRKSQEKSKSLDKQIDELRKERSNKEAIRISTDIVGDIGDEAFTEGIKNAEKREKEIKENERKQRELLRKRTQEAKREREKAKNVSKEIIELEKIRNKKQISKEIVSDIIEGTENKSVAKNVVESAIAGGILKSTQQKGGVKISTKGAKSRTEGVFDIDNIITSWERNTPNNTNKEKKKKEKDSKTIRQDLTNKNTAEIEKSKLLQELVDFGLDGKILAFNANRFTPVKSQNEDTRMKQMVKDLMMERPKQYPKELQNRIMVKIQELLNAKYTLREAQNKIRKYKI